MGAVTGRCAVKAGDTVSVEMHQQPGSRSCSSEAIGGDHFGPIHVYMSSVADARTADGSSGWFKIYADTWSHNSSGSNGQADNWGTKDLNNCCGHVDVKIPTDIPAGDYLLRSEVIALHVASSPGGAQFYISCYQITVSGGGSASPALVKFPGAYSSSDPGILVNIYGSMSTYVDPGPTVYSGGVNKTPGGACTGYAASESGGSVASPTVYTPGSGSGPTSAASSPTTAPAGSTTLKTSAIPTTVKASSASPTTVKTSAAPTSTSGSGGCTVAKYAQCGGTGWTGCTVCAAGSTCTGSGYYYQCA